MRVPSNVIWYSHQVPIKYFHDHSIYKELPPDFLTKTGIVQGLLHGYKNLQGASLLHVTRDLQLFIALRILLFSDALRSCQRIMDSSSTWDLLLFSAWIHPLLPVWSEGKAGIPQKSPPTGSVYPFGHSETVSESIETLRRCNSFFRRHDSSPNNSEKWAFWTLEKKRTDRQRYCLYVQKSVSEVTRLLMKKCYKL